MKHSVVRNNTSLQWTYGNVTHCAKSTLRHRRAPLSSALGGKVAHMMISFHTKLFDTTSAIPDDSFRGEDLARWLEQRLTGWSSSVISEDWGWAIVAKKGDLKYIFGVYDHDTDESNEHGPKWVLRLFNERDRTKRFQKLFRNIPPGAHDEVVKEISEILRQSDTIADIKMEPL